MVTNESHQYAYSAGHSHRSCRCARALAHNNKRRACDPKAFFWQIQEGNLPQPAAAITLGMNILHVDPEVGVLEAEFEGKPEFTNPAGNIQGVFYLRCLMTRW